ncbi:glycosyl hydrolase family 18 protein [Litchfieldia alkalitelluris]|uniref:glycosyl hydrolase family 18 protein n=1 Tax=Litchfieldia alkalitelluris TaxID=304268 RepID=UPI000998767A|nr:glycosyl hydrolase family 18 protein [Litchfieldia alkalitelluris]
MSQMMTKTRSTKTKMIILGFIGSLFLVISSIVLLIYPFPSKEKVIYTNKQFPIVANGEIYKSEAVIKNGVSYFPLDFVKEYIDDSIFLDAATNSVIITTKNKVLQMPSNSLTYLVNEEPLNLEVPVFISDQEEPYLDLKTFEDLFQIKVEIHQESGIHVVRFDGDVLINGSVKLNDKVDDLRLRTEPNVTTPYLDQVEVEEKVIIEFEEEGFYYVRKDNGVGGFIEKGHIKLGNTEKIRIAREEVPAPPNLKWPIHLVWEAVYSSNPDVNKLNVMPGVNVVSPTWFSLKNGKGDITNLGSDEYVKWAKEQKYHIWGLFSNDFDPDKTHEAFKDFETRKKMISQLLHYSEIYQLDGINIDIENVYEEDGPLITQFVREATPYLHEAGLVVSMDVTFISDSPMWSKFYEREKLSEIVDYMVVMAYDEHWGTSPKAGSVASLPWVEKNLRNLLEVVPSERLILGIPLYSRIWKEKETDGGNIEVSSKAYGMDQIQDWIDENKLEVEYDKATGQNFAEYYDEKEKTLYKVWLEDETSLEKRVQLVHEYNLAGIAAWTRSFANDKAWTEMNESLSRKNPVKENNDSK